MSTTLSNQLRLPAQAYGLTAARIRLVICLSLYGGTLGGAALLVHFLAFTEYPKDPEHLTFIATVFLSGGAALICAIFVSVFALWLTTLRDREDSHGVLTWLAIGFGFGVLSPVVTGLGLTISTLFLHLSINVIRAGELPMAMLSAVMRAPSIAVTHAVFSLYTGLLAGALFGCGAWVLDRANYSTNPRISAYAPYLLALLLSILFYSIAAFGPPDSLAKLG